jgi:hypothetical protein
VDYRTYPIQIDWPLVEDLKSDAFPVFQNYGYLGISLFTCISNNKSIFQSSDKFMACTVDYYLVQFNKSYLQAENFIKSLPNLNSLSILLEKGLLSQKEKICFKVILDIYFHFYNNYCLGSPPSLDSPLPLIIRFYKSLNYEDANHIFDQIKSSRELYSCLRALNVKLTKKKIDYIIFYQKIEEKIKLLENGIKLDKLIR